MAISIGRTPTSFMGKEREWPRAEPAAHRKMPVGSAWYIEQIGLCLPIVVQTKKVADFPFEISSQWLRGGDLRDVPRSGVGVERAGSVNRLHPSTILAPHSAPKTSS